MLLTSHGVVFHLHCGRTWLAIRYYRYPQKSKKEEKVEKIGSSEDYAMTLTTRAMHMIGTNLLHSICFSALPFEMF